jgi:hypothetical protein
MTAESLVPFDSGAFASCVIQCMGSAAGRDHQQANVRQELVVRGGHSGQRKRSHNCEATEEQTCTQHREQDLK